MMPARVKKPYILYSFIFITFLIIGLCTPYCHDEWNWGTDESMMMLYNGFSGYNGRLIGNILALIITRSNVLKGIVISAFTTLFIRLCHLLYEKEQDKIFVPCMAVLLLLFMPNLLFEQIFGWSAAFVNFFPPVVIWMGIVYLIYPLINDGHYTGSKYNYLWLFVLGIVMELFSENNSIYGLMFAVSVIIYGYYKEGKLHKDWISLLIGTIIGFLVMFLNPAYRNAVAGTDGYKEIGVRNEESFVSFVLSKYEEMAEPLFTNNTVIIILICLLLIWLVVKGIKAENKHRGIRIFSVVFLGSVIAFMLLATPTLRVKINIFGEFYHKLNFLFSLGFFICVLFCIWDVVKGNARKRLMFYILSIPLVVGPLIMAAPIGARCFITSYCIMILIALELMMYLEVPEILEKNNRQHLFAGVVTITMLYYICTLMVIGISYRQWFVNIDELNETGAKKLTLKELPGSQYYWITTPPNETWEILFREFYNIDDDVKISFVK